MCPCHSSAGNDRLQSLIIAETIHVEHGRGDAQNAPDDAGLPNKAPLDTLLEKRSDLNLTGKVRKISIQAGHGGSSDIFTGLYTPASGTECKVAVKRMRAHIIEDRKFQKALANELYIWAKLNHPRILPLEGFYIEDNAYPCLISRWMEKGTVLKYLKTKPTTDLLSLVTGIAEGIHYLHTKEIVHSDIKPDNVLICDSGEPVLCDFGVSRMLARSGTFPLSSTSTSGLSGTIRYMSRDILQDEHARHTKESDVWAFGMTVFTLLTMQLPYHDITSEVRILLAIVDGLLPSWPESATSWPFKHQFLRRMCELCWEEQSTRPSMDIFISELQTLNRLLRRPLSDFGSTSYEFRYLSPADTNQGLSVPCSQFSDIHAPSKKFKAFGTANHTSPNRISCSFVVDGYQFTFDATSSPGLPQFTSKTANIYFDDSDELTGTQSYTGFVGVSSYSLTLHNGTVIIGNLEVSRLGCMNRTSGSGVWLST